MKILIFDKFEHEKLSTDANGKLCKYLFWRTSNSGKPTYMRETQARSGGAWVTIVKAYAKELNAVNWCSKLSDCVK